ncbi:hypothetical protein, partial [Burkholderia gladioli]|uniref:hypothetical protein n=1 Tax=Burkholderia gladioli TaxID=28095 RepID=UPI0034DB051F
STARDAPCLLIPAAGAESTVPGGAGLAVLACVSVMARGAARRPAAAMAMGAALLRCRIARSPPARSTR